MCALKYRKIINFVKLKVNIRLETFWYIHVAARFIYVMIGLDLKFK